MIDLHTHSTASDGTLAPAALVARAAAAGIRILALTDHDTVEGCREALAAADRHAVELVPGIELSVRFEHGQMHLLGWLGRPDPPALMARLGAIGDARDVRNRAIVARLAAIDAPVSWGDVAARAGGRVGRPHIAAALVAAGHAASVPDAFDRLIGLDGPAFVGIDGLGPSAAIALVRDAGGVSCLAHPRTLGLDDERLDELVADLAAAGLDALEAHRADGDPAEQAALAALARRHGLVAAGGSDYHGPSSDPNARTLGSTGVPGAEASQLEALLSRRRA